jgi:hypothetical protein
MRAAILLGLLALTAFVTVVAPNASAACDMNTIAPAGVYVASYYVCTDGTVRCDVLHAVECSDLP